MEAGGARERTIEVNGARLWLAEQGSGIPLLLASGGPGCCDYMEPVAAMVDDLARVVRYEPRGCGRSSANGPYDLRTTLDDLDALRATLGIDRWIVGGHSAGASFALAYALAHAARVAGVLYMCGPGLQNDREWHLAYRAGRDAGRDQEPPYLYPPNLDVNRDANESWRRFIKSPDLWRRIAGCPAPLLAIAGSDDVRPPWPAEQLAAAVPRGRFERIDGAGHVPWLTHAPELRALVRKFIEDVRDSTQV